MKRTKINARWEIAQLRAEIAKTDWIVAKCYDEQVPTIEKYPDLHAMRADARKRINELQSELETLPDDPPIPPRKDQQEKTDE